MSSLPLAAFPIAGKVAQSSGFVFAVLIGLALYLAAKNKPVTTNQGQLK